MYDQSNNASYPAAPVALVCGHMSNVPLGGVLGVIVAVAVAVAVRVIVRV